jgi:hypothetical protein
MFPDCLTAETGEISNMSSKHWMTSGISWRGEYWTQNTLERPSAAAECSLSQVIKTTAPRECFLGIEHLEKWLARANYRSVPLPAQLEAAFKKQISLLSNTPPSEENRKPGRKQKDTETMGKPIRSIQEEVRTLYVRRMMASEYEVLQGFPENWTLVEQEL